jgi:hypothetical protein
VGRTMDDDVKASAQGEHVNVKKCKVLVNFSGRRVEESRDEEARGSEADGGLCAGVLWEVGRVAGAAPGLPRAAPSGVVGVAGIRCVGAPRLGFLRRWPPFRALPDASEVSRTFENSSVPFFETAYKTRDLIRVPTTFLFFAEFLAAGKLGGAVSCSWFR